MFYPRYILMMLLSSLLFSNISRATDQQERWNEGWAVYADNDLFVPTASNRDSDYTGGLSLTQSGLRARDTLLSLDAARAQIGGWLQTDEWLKQRDQFRHSIEYGVTIFTPKNLTEREQQIGDRPYAGLLYIASTAAEVDEQQGVSVLSTFTIGILGSKMVEQMQVGLHNAIGATKPVGWDRQISDGGELTVRYSVARTTLDHQFVTANQGVEITSSWRASVGYLTEATFGVAARIGKLNSPWWSYNPQVADYAEKSVPVSGAGAEHYWWGGFALHARVYNVFLQGQFRHSDYRLNNNELRPFIGEAWLGYTHAWQSGWRLSYNVRAQSSEIQSEPGNRTVIWGEFVISQAF